MKNSIVRLVCASGMLIAAPHAWSSCSSVTGTELEAAYNAAVAAHTGGYQVPAGLNMWVTFVDETGKVCQIYTKNGGAAAGNSAWLGSRVISAQKAFTANAFSLDGYAISTANLYTAVQGDNSLFGLQLSNPVDSSVAYLGDPSKYGVLKNGQSKDPLVGKRIGGVNVFGGGLAIYDPTSHKKLGAIGVSGDTSCRDHAFAWQIRGNLKKSVSNANGMHPFNNGSLMPTPGFPNGAGTDKGTGITTYNIDKNGVVQSALTNAKYGDEMILRSTSPTSDYWQNNWSHPTCPGSVVDINITGPGNSVDTPENGILTNGDPSL